MTPTSLTLHYYSTRPGLTMLVVGIVKGVAATFFNDLALSFKLLRSQTDGTDDHDVFRISYPPQTLAQRWELPAAAQQQQQQLASAAGGRAATADGAHGAGVVAAAAGGAARYSCSPEEFMALHPFHVLLDAECRVAQVGELLARLVPELQAGARVDSVLQVRRLYTRPPHSTSPCTHAMGCISPAHCLAQARSGCAITLSAIAVSSLVHVTHGRPCMPARWARRPAWRDIRASPNACSFLEASALLYMNDVPCLQLKHCCM